MSIVLSAVKANCPHCAFTSSQISDRDHAIQVVTEAMEKHIADEHPDAP